MKYILFAIYIALTTIALVLIKLSGSDNSFSLSQGNFSVTVNIRYLFGLIFYIVSFLLFTVVLSKFNLSIFYPAASSIIIVLSVLAGVFVLHERLTAANIAGIVLILCGVVVMNLKFGG